MTIASVVQGLIETEDGKVFELDSCKGSAWLGSISSFRYEPTGANKPYTVRQEAKKGGDYWYGYRKVAGKLHKKYIGKSSELSTAKLEEIAEALNTPQKPRVTPVANTVTQITETVTDSCTAERVTALELQMQVLRESLESLRSELLGKPDGLSNLSELPNPYKVTDSELQIVLGNLKTELSNLATENEKIRADYAALLESSTVVTKKMKEEASELRAQLEAKRNSQKEVEAELAKLAADREELAQLKKWAKENAAEIHREGNAIKVETIRWQRELGDARAELADAKATILNQGNKIRELERGYSLQPNPAESRLRLEIGELRSELADLKQKSAAASKDLPEAADLYNQLKTKRKKSSASLADVELILEMIEEF
jgi:chromosome segregation ATPase